MPERVEVHMRDSDAFAWYMEKDPLLRSTVVCVLLLDGSPDWDRLPERLERSTRLSPGFRHRVVLPPLRLATPRWVVDPDFDLSWHVRRFEAAPPKTLATVLEFARKTGMAGLDRDRPLWEFTFIEGLEGGQTALVMKLHHSLTDGVGGMDIARLLFDVEPDPGDLGPMPEAPVGEHLGTVDLARDALGYDWSQLFDFSKRHLTSAVGDVAHALRHPRETVTETVATGQSIARFVAPVSDTLSPVMTERHLAWHYDVLEFPLAEMLRAAHAAGAKHNDAFLSGVTAGLRLYHERHDTQVDELRVTMPVSIRKADDPIGGNRITLMRFKVPVGIADPSERMAETHRRCESVKTDRSLPFTNAIAGHVEPAAARLHRRDAQAHRLPREQRARNPGAALPHRREGRQLLRLRPHDRRRLERHADVLLRHLLRGRQHRHRRRARPRRADGLPAAGLRRGSRRRRRYRACGAADRRLVTQ